MAANKKTEKASCQAEHKFTKDQILAAGKYVGREDLLNALIKDGERLTLKEVEERVRGFRKGKVN